ncbi:MAG: hypothetical protein COV47_03540 [Candidatus Diapherotrites archaeon CG11_big_fil_rev_8_21_14_0_20_37_9]|nr:MAG: hypothetical protein COV47_03540 [Candidatus Diapherotrites archaeon CG11_big_fil_rev_8_21_14_0_20_37_9]
MRKFPGVPKVPVFGLLVKRAEEHKINWDKNKPEELYVAMAHLIGKSKAGRQKKLEWGQGKTYAANGLSIEGASVIEYERQQIVFPGEQTQGFKNLWINQTIENFVKWGIIEGHESTKLKSFLLRKLRKSSVNKS